MTCASFKRANRGKGNVPGCCFCLLMVRLKHSLLAWVFLLFAGALTYLYFLGILKHPTTLKTPMIKSQDHDLDRTSNTMKLPSLWSGMEDVDAQRENLALYDPIKVTGQGQNNSAGPSSQWSAEESGTVIIDGSHTLSDAIKNAEEKSPPVVERNVTGEHQAPVGVKVKVKVNETLPVQRDVRVQELWPDVQRGEDEPEKEVFDTVHWFWCGAEMLQLRHYLSVLSAVRILQPLKLIMHHTDLPKTDLYNTWFNELKDSLPNLELKKLAINVSCESTDTWRYALEILSLAGGVFLGENVILTRFPKEARNSTFWFALPDSAPSSAINGVVFASKPLDAGAKEASLQKLMSSNQYGCTTIEIYDNQTKGGQAPHCIFTASRVIVPRDFMQLDTLFGELARWLFYGRRAVIHVEKEATPIPRISHFIRILTGKSQYQTDLSFGHFISVLSALHVAGFQRVFVHADVEPNGPWWRHLVEKENVTYVPLVKPESVYQRPVKVTAHVSDIIRYLLLYKYGGAYQDWDVFWAQYLPDSYLSHPAIIGYDWNTRGWVDNVNNGVMLARTRAHWMHHFLATHRDFRDANWGYNSLMMSYRTWELYPWTAFLDRRLQVLCHFGTCHPTWINQYKYPGKDKEPLSLLNDTYAVHVTFPKPPASLASLDNLRKRGDVFAVLGKTILEKSGRKSWLDSNFTLPADLKTR